MKNILFQIDISVMDLIIAVVTVAAVIALAVILKRKPWYSGKGNSNFYPESALSLVKKKNDLKILQVTDLHIDRSNTQHELIWKNLKQLVSSNDIDLTVVTGDWTSDKDNRPAAERLVEVMESCKKPWAVVFGNHDAQGNVKKDGLAEIFLKAENCLFYGGNSTLSGMGNYVINVYNSNSPEHLDASLIFLDSQTDTARTMHYQPVFRDQVRWYKNCVGQLKTVYKNQSGNKAKKLPSILFQHIPLKEYETAWKNAEIDTSKHIHGNKNEKICAPDVNTGLFKKITALGSTRAVFCGHDHSNDFAVNYKNVILAYGVQTGVCESDPYAQKLPKGGNLITLYEDGTVGIERVYNETPYKQKGQDYEYSH